MAVNGLELIEPSVLYNMLQQGTAYTRLTDPNYLLLAESLGSSIYAPPTASNYDERTNDARIKSEYNESHVMTAKKAPKNEQGFFTVPYDAELECKQNIVVYDNKTTSISDIEAPAVMCARLWWNLGSRNPVKVLRGGYEEFSALYPFLRTEKIIYMPRELDEIKPYPVEILDGFLYLGNWRQGNSAQIQKDLKIKAHINMCVEKETFFKEKGPELLHIPVEDSNDVDLFPHMPQACTFIEEHRKQNEAVLVFSQLGISRSATIVIAYLMKHKTWPLELAYHHVAKCQNALRPNRAFIEQLSLWEEMLCGVVSTNVADPNF